VGLTVASALGLCGAVLLAEAGLSLGPLQWALGLAWVLVVPGYWLTLALFPSAADLDGPERAGLALGLSVAWAPVLALVLDRLPWGIRLWPILVGELVSVALFAAVALGRGARLPAGAAYAPGRPQPRVWWRDQPAADRWVYGVVAAALLVGAVAAATVFLVPSPDEFFTEFYVLGAGGLAEDYPREAAVGEALEVTLGITNRERHPLTYQVEVWAVDPWSEVQSRVGTAGPVALAPGETWEAPLTWQMPQAGEDQQVQFLLFRAGDAAPYRQLRLWLDVGEAGR
jgi:uncharacterized membrane protein